MTSSKMLQPFVNIFQSFLFNLLLYDSNPRLRLRLKNESNLSAHFLILGELMEDYSLNHKLRRFDTCVFNN